MSNSGTKWSTTTEGSPKDPYTKCKRLFDLSKKSNLNFITINPNKGLNGSLRVNKISKWSDYLRRYSDHFFIVREKEHNIHFHAIVSLNKELKFVKGVHFNVQPVLDNNNNKHSYMTRTEVLTYQMERLGELIEAGLSTEEADEVLQLHMQRHDALQRDKQRKSRAFLQDKKDNKLYNIFLYMIKEEPSIQFEDYVFCIDKVQTEATEFRKPTLAAAPREPPLQAQAIGTLSSKEEDANGVERSGTECVPSDVN